MNGVGGPALPTNDCLSEDNYDILHLTQGHRNSKENKLLDREK